MEEFMCTLKTHKWCGRSKSKDTYLFSYVSFFWLNKIFTIKIIYIRIRKKNLVTCSHVRGRFEFQKGNEIVVVVKVTEARGWTSEWEQGWLALLRKETCVEHLSRL